MTWEELLHLISRVKLPRPQKPVRGELCCIFQIVQYAHRVCHWMCCQSVFHARLTRAKPQPYARVVLISARPSAHLPKLRTCRDTTIAANAGEWAHRARCRSLFSVWLRRSDRYRDTVIYGIHVALHTLRSSCVTGTYQVITALEFYRILRENAVQFVFLILLELRFCKLLQLININSFFLQT